MLNGENMDKKFIAAGKGRGKSGTDEPELSIDSETRRGL